ncbi:MAG TPA: ABC transporter ATP-binding protein [Dehalococcoidia bacterium]|nr:ABC transporter ATP-binding protein [Dehalococcoidia bacterium]
MFYLRQLRVHYGTAEIIKGISIAVEQGDIVSILGTNGAGKTTILRTISGLKCPTSGEIWFRNQRIDGLPAYKIVSLGVAQCPERRRLFHSMKVIDNLLLGAFLRKDKKEIEKDLENLFEHFPILRTRSEQIAGSLSGGEQEMVAIGRSLMSRPKLLLMDEPTLGLSPVMVVEVGRIISGIKQAGIGIILVEQNARMALKVSNKAYVLETGRISLEGESLDVVKDEHVRRSYLGGT